MWTLSSLFYLHRLCREEELRKKSSIQQTPRPRVTLCPQQIYETSLHFKRPSCICHEGVVVWPPNITLSSLEGSGTNSSCPIVNGFYCPTLKAEICWNTCLRDHNFGGPRAAESPSSNDCKSGKAKIKIAGFWGENYETYPYHVNINIPTISTSLPCKERTSVHLKSQLTFFSETLMRKFRA